MRVVERGEMGRRNRENWLTYEVGGAPVWMMILAAFVIAGVAVFALTRPPEPEYVAQPRETPSETHSPTASAAIEPVEMVVVGDSLSESNSPDFTAGDIGDGSWVYYAATGGVEFAGGWAEGGATSGAQAEVVEPAAGDVLVVGLGTNDNGQQLSFDETASNLESIAATIGIQRVVVLAIPPREDELAVTTTAFNAALESLARENGWEYLDAAASVRDGDAWASGMTSDGIHFTTEAAQIIGDVVHDYLAP